MTNKEISQLEKSIDMHLVALSNTYDLTERMMYQNNLDKYKTRYFELTGKEYEVNPEIFKEEESEWNPINSDYDGNEKGGGSL